MILLFAKMVEYLSQTNVSRQLNRRLIQNLSSDGFHKKIVVLEKQVGYNPVSYTGRITKTTIDVVRVGKPLSKLLQDNTIF